MRPKFSGRNTRCVHSGNYVSSETGGVNTPIFASTSFLFPNPSGTAFYPRYFNIPTQTAAAEKVRALEGGERGLVLSSGMAAITSVLFALLGRGDHAVFQRDLYGGTHHFVTSELEKFGIGFSFASGEAVADFESEARENTRVIFLESPSNPLLRIVDLAALARFARERGILTVMDNTFATPLNQTPLDLGIDVVVHSGTKYLNGHSDVNCGAVVASRELMERIMPFAVNHGGTLDVHACYMLERGMKTLGLRVERHNENAARLAAFLEAHPLVRKVYYPGLPGHEGHETARAQMRGFGGMLSFELDCGTDSARRRAGRLEVITPAVSLGGVESLICFPAETSHAKMSAAQRRRAGISDSLLRLSVGVEDAEDLEADLERMLSG
ncbi:MAG: PLP-dependent aspartate aminotransferase family protein [Nitrospirota bacterium]|jgi:cystathionine beta-lyase